MKQVFEKKKKCGKESDIAIYVMQPFKGLRFFFTSTIKINNFYDKYSEGTYILLNFQGA